MSVTISLRGAKEAREMLDSLSGRELVNRTKRATRRGAKVMRTEVRSEAKSRGDLPHTFAKTATRAHRSPLGVSTGPTSPLLPIFENGASGHTIGQGGQLLRNRVTGFRARGPVHHPGFRARPLIAPVFAATKDEAADEAMDELLKGLK